MATAYLGITFATITCCHEGCGCVFAVTEQMKAILHSDPNRWFYCPNGHRQHFTESTEDRLRREVREERQRRETAERDRDACDRMYRSAERGKAIIQGKHRKLKERVAAGLCPCCNRPFANMLAHIHNEHPEYVGEVGHGGGDISK